MIVHNVQCKCYSVGIMVPLFPFQSFIFSAVIRLRQIRSLLIIKCLLYKGERSANKFRKSQIREFADLQYLLNLRTLWICDLRIPFFADLNLPQKSKNIIFLLTNTGRSLGSSAKKNGPELFKRGFLILSVLW
jgi:hypothetical protein